MEELEYVSIPLHGKYGRGRVTLVDGDYDGEYFSQYKWYVNPLTGLVYRQDYQDKTATTVLLHQEVGRAPKGMWLKHKNGNKLDNRSCNLEWITPQYSALTRSLPRTRGIRHYKGVVRPVSQPKNGQKWVGTRWAAKFRGKHLGTFDLEEQAARAYDEAAKAYYGDMAQLNFPNDN